MQSIRLEGVERTFHGVQAVRELDLEVRPGEFLTLLGPSGCGKTTTLRMVAGLEHNTKGKIWIGDTLVSDAPRRQYVPSERRKLGMVFQSYAIWPHMTVFENVAYPLRLRHLRSADIEQRVTATLRLVGLEGAAQRSATALSGGQQQRVAIARALVYEPQVLLLDEPLSNLDAKLRGQMGEEFRSLQKRLGITCLYVTHDQEEAMALSDRIVVMQAGQVQQIGSPEEIYHQPASRAVATFFGSPSLLPARVTQATASAGTTALVVEGEGWSARCQSHHELKIGAKVAVVVRPEHLDVVRGAVANAEAMALWRGKVVNSTFKGARRSLSVETQGAMLTIDVPAIGSPVVGEEIDVAAKPGTLWAIPE